MRINQKQLNDKLKNNKVLISNFSYISALQIINLLIPLITYPYLIRILGKETFGLVAFAQAIIGYLVIVTDYGFNISATKEISIYRDNKDKISEIVSSVLLIKLGLLLFAVILLFLLLYTIPTANEHKLLFMFSMWAVFYSVLFPTWYFQGIEQMKFITYITLTSRLVFLCLIFALIHLPDDYLLIPLINGLGAIIAGTISLIIIFGQHKVEFKFQSFGTLSYYLKDSTPVFVSSVFSQIYVSSNKVIVGAFLSMTDVAYYDLSEKIISLLKMPQGIFSQSIFPKISKEKSIRLIKNTLYITVLMNISLFALILIFGKYVILLLGGSQMLPSSIILDILAITLPIVGVSNVLGILILIPFGFQKRMTLTIITAGMIYCIIMLVLYSFNHINIYSISLATILTEICISLMCYLQIKKLKLL